MDKIRHLLFFVFIFNISCTDKAIDMVGIWQNSSIAASGWTDTYQMFPDGTFKFNYNQMICDKRTISFIGDWEIDKSGSLLLTVKQNVIHVGGELVPASGSCASDYEIEGGEIKVISIDSPKSINATLSNFYIDTDIDNKETVEINGIRYWKINKNPDSY